MSTSNDEQQAGYDDEAEWPPLDCNYGEVSLPLPEGGVGIPFTGPRCPNRWNTRAIEAWGNTPANSRAQLLALARRLSEQTSLQMECGALECSNGVAGVCKFRSQLATNAIIGVRWLDLQSNERHVEFLAKGTLRTGCFCDNTV